MWSSITRALSMHMNINIATKWLYMIVMRLNDTIGIWHVLSMTIYINGHKDHPVNQLYNHNTYICIYMERPSETLYLHVFQYIYEVMYLVLSPSRVGLVTNAMGIRNLSMKIVPIYSLLLESDFVVDVNQNFGNDFFFY